MNITEYKLKEDDFKIYCGKADIADEKFGIYNGDESFYRMVGKKSGLSIVDLLHPEDVECFREAVAHVDEEPQCLVVRFLAEEDVYHYVYMKVEFEGTVVHGERFFSIEITDILAITEQFKEYEDMLEMYRRYMSLCDDIFMEYDYKDKSLRFYEYFNSQNRMIYKQNLDEAANQVKTNRDLSDKQKEEFVTFVDVIEQKSDRLKITIDAQLFIPHMKGVQLECSCATIYKDDMHYKLVGICRTVNQTLIDQPFYMSEYAIDAATGVLNKKAIQEYALESIQSGRLKYFVILDIDNFKQINDRFGHLYGDEVIAKCAEIFKSVIQNRGVVGRFGGDEFLFVLEYVDSEEELRRIIKTIAKHAQWAYREKDEMNVTFSSGVVQYPKDGQEYETLMKTADKCLYIAKSKGKNRFIIYREELHGSVEKDVQTNRIVGLNATISDADKHVLLSDMIMQLYKDKHNAIVSVMEKMRSHYDIDAVSIYAGKEMKRIFSCGQYVNSIESFMGIFEPAYLEFFDRNDFYDGELMARIEKRSETVHVFNTRQEIGKSIQCVLKKENEPVALISFDFFNRCPKMGCLDNGMIRTIGKLMVQIAAENVE